MSQERYPRYKELQSFYRALNRYDHLLEADRRKLIERFLPPNEKPTMKEVDMIRSMDDELHQVKEARKAVHLLMGYAEDREGI